jgi:hypothetical protein
MNKVAPKRVSQTSGRIHRSSRCPHQVGHGLSKAIVFSFGLTERSFSMPDVQSIGLGGGSRVHTLEASTGETRVAVGPE